MSAAVPPVRVTAVVVTYQSARTLPATLASIRRCHAAGLLDCIVVDNGSNDGTTGILEQEAYWARVHLTGRNNGFGRGCNIGLAEVSSEYTLFLNPDASLEPDALRTMIAFMDESPRVGIAGPATVSGSDAVAAGFQGTGPRPTPGSVFRAAVPLLRTPSDLHPIHPGAAPFQTGWVCGAVFMVRTALMKQMGGFDPRFFLYWEETDVCRRAEDLGFQTWAMGTAIANHIGGASSSDDDSRIAGCIAKHYYQSRRYYLIKHHGWARATAAEVAEFLFLCIRAAADIVRGRSAARIRPRLQAPLLSEPEIPQVPT